MVELPRNSKKFEETCLNVAPLILLAGCSVAALLNMKFVLSSFVLDAILNVASNCGGETAAGGLGAGAGSLACEEDSYTPGPLASNVDPFGDTRGPRNNSYENARRYTEQLRSTTNSQGGSSNTSSTNGNTNAPSGENQGTDSKDTVNTSPATKQSNVPADGIKFDPPDSEQV